jgi:Domain of unknown function (DUF5659)
MKSDPTDPATFDTTDYGLAAFLWCSGIEPQSVERPGRDVSFVYRVEPSLLTAISAYSGNAPVKCRDFFNALRRAKVTISEIIRGENYHAKATAR